MADRRFCFLILFIEVLAENESAIGLVSISAGDLDGAHYKGGPNPRLGRHLPGWLLRDAVTKATKLRMTV